ncbi:MAG TPA: CDP-diacylglycerol--serine O-phosphatidyltransferase [Gemmatales bacterium]|nr:CDP-diacylglycerol--serine O-phosphatidyltransferase [Gemmatales bacterium]
MKTFHWRQASRRPRSNVLNRMRKVAILPTLCTLANGMCGVTAIMFFTNIGPAATVDHSLSRYIAGWLLFLAMLFDVLDGYLARRANQASQFGAELDSLCDAVSFGAAPAIFLVQLGDYANSDLARKLSYMIALLYVSCAILRLARFNVTTALDAKSHRYFQGLPSPAAAGCIASLVIIRYNLTELKWVSIDTANLIMAIASPLAGFVVALLMVSRTQYIHMANRVLMRRKNFSKVVQALLVVMAVVLFRELALGLCFWGYALYGPVVSVWNRMNKPEPIPVSTEPSMN